MTAPEGSFLNPVFPAPVKMKPSSGHYVPIAILDALEDVVEERMLAESGNKTLLYLSGHHPNGEAFSDLMFVMGGMGARAGMDGLHTMSFPANSSNIPVEVLESVAPVRVRRKHLRADSGGAGGLGGRHSVNGVAVADKLPVVLRAGDVMTLEIPGSGGLGPARERDRAAVVHDVADGIVTPEAALADYGVEVDVEAGG